MYTPNPNPTAYISPNINKTVYTNNYKLRGAEFWTAGENQKEWKQSIQIYGVDLETQPYIVSRNDDSLENIKEYIEIKKIEARYEQETNISTLTFTTIGDNPPGWVISIDLFIMMSKKGSGEWSKVIIPANTTPNMSNQIEITVDEANEIYSLNNVTGDRELIVFCAKPNDLYNNITNVTFGKNNNTGSYIFNFNSTEFNDITEDTILYVCQMNNISNQILTHNVITDNWKEYSTTLTNSVTKEKEIYYVYTYSPSIALLGKHQPLIYSIGENKEIFDQIVEIKIYNGSLMLYAKNKINNNFDIKIIDFK